MEIIEIKKDQQQYISEIAALESDIFPDPWSEKSIRDTLENPQARIWAIISRQASSCSCASTAPEHAGKPQLLGYVIFYYVLDEGEIARIATSPQHRRQGVAVRLLEKCVHLVTSRILQDGCWMFVFPMKQQYIFTRQQDLPKTVCERISMQTRRKMLYL
ncbi:MAG: GNAT family N-acetyltransferase [Dorea formicigenerans]